MTYTNLTNGCFNLSIYHQLENKTFSLEWKRSHSNRKVNRSQINCFVFFSSLFTTDGYNWKCLNTAGSLLVMRWETRIVRLWVQPSDLISLKMYFYSALICQRQFEVNKTWKQPLVPYTTVPYALFPLSGTDQTSPLLPGLE